MIEQATKDMLEKDILMRIHDEKNTLAEQELKSQAIFAARGAIFSGGFLQTLLDGYANHCRKSVDIIFDVFKEYMDNHYVNPLDVEHDDIKIVVDKFILDCDTNFDGHMKFKFAHLDRGGNLNKLKVPFQHQYGLILCGAYNRIDLFLFKAKKKVGKNMSNATNVHVHGPNANIAVASGNNSTAKIDNTVIVNNNEELFKLLDNIIESTKVNHNQVVGHDNIICNAENIKLELIKEHPDTSKLMECGGFLFKAISAVPTLAHFLPLLAPALASYGINI